MSKWGLKKLSKYWICVYAHYIIYTLHEYTHDITYIYMSYIYIYTDIYVYIYNSIIIDWTNIDQLLSNGYCKCFVSKSKEYSMAPALMVLAV